MMIETKVCIDSNLFHALIAYVIIISIAAILPPTIRLIRRRILRQ